VIIEQCARDKTPLPARIANAPELLLGLDLYYLAFFDLTSCRSLGYGIEGPITWLTVDEYADRIGLEGDQREDLHFHISRMDKTYLDFRAKKHKSDTKSPAKGGKRK
jgi:hypothetical protein